MGLMPPHFPTPPASAPPARRAGSASGGRGLSFGAWGAFAPLAGLRPAPPASQAGASNPAVPITKCKRRWLLCRWRFCIPAGGAAALRSDPPIAQRLDREDNREPTGHSEDIQSPDEQQGAALLEKLRAQSIPHVQRQHAGGQHAAQ